MKYYILITGKYGIQTWQQTEFNPFKRQIKLYDDNLEFYGIGLY